jgi:hypothetical protein
MEAIRSRKRYVETVDLTAVFAEHRILPQSAFLINHFCTTDGCLQGLKIPGETGRNP